MTNDPKGTQILISDQDTGLPYSKGLMASQVMVTGLSPMRAYQVAEAVEERLRGLGVPSVSSAQLGELAHEVLEELAGERYARNFLRWREVEALDVPLVVLIGGTTGVGKSTIATQLATRLGIVRVVATDAIREVMRALFSYELMPTLHTSSFEAGTVLREPSSRDTVVIGFREQTAAVAVGVQALVKRAVDRMQPDQRQAFILFELDGLTGKQVAKIGGRSLPTTLRQRYEAQRVVQAILGVEKTRPD